MHGNSLVKRTGLNSTYTTKYCNVATTVKCGYAILKHVFLHVRESVPGDGDR